MLLKLKVHRAILDLDPSSDIGEAMGDYESGDENSCGKQGSRRSQQNENQLKGK